VVFVTERQAGNASVTRAIWELHALLVAQELDMGKSAQEMAGVIGMLLTKDGMKVVHII
jgi:hypothetical protein